MANFRPSNILKNIEDGIGFAVGSVGRKAGKFGHDVKVEFRARQLAAEERRVRKMAEKFSAMSPEDQADLARESAEILGRAAQLLRNKR